ncbi:MAG: hypothetical protein EKK64_06570 [Neisseriaceae bacterium]|nr:MAG: hypothetical protein EKK64_06570 [Neisseriaceae bacterium]
MYSLTYNVFNKIWRKNQIPHRKIIGQPAVEYPDGTKFYWWNCLEYTISKTDEKTEIIAIIDNNDHKLQSFDDNPSVTYTNGTKEWHCVGLLHRYSGPAVQYSNGDVEYWNWGKLNRLDGPAVIYGNKQYWFYRGEFVKCIIV